MTERPPPTMLGFLNLPELVQVAVLFAAFGAFAYCIETENFIAAGIIVGFFITYFVTRRQARRHRRRQLGGGVNQGSYQRRRRPARRDVDGDAPDD